MSVMKMIKAVRFFAPLFTDKGIIWVILIRKSRKG